MRNAQWFINKQNELKKEEEKHILEINKQWVDIVDTINNFEIEPEDKYILFKEPILKENINKLEDDFNFYVCNIDNKGRIYFRKDDFDKLKWIHENKDNSIYNIHDKAHENSRVDNVYNREKAKKDMNKVLNKSNDDKKDKFKKLNNKFSKLTSIYNYYTIFGFDSISREIFKLNNIDITKIKNEINKCVEEIESLEKELGINKQLMNE